ncbi:MAG: HlyD family efflux transporter periplasmic adaptor subunit [Burkholderiaceae bacterium]|nr:HlyD family efflux transporter periplasmic adaptor subunit [Burkholderiaceae bacterium]
MSQPQSQPVPVRPVAAPEVALHPAVQRWLQQHCQSAREVCAGVALLQREGSAQLAAEWPVGGVLTPPLLNAARAALQRGRPVVVVPTVRLVGASHNRVLALPVRAAAAGDDAPAAERPVIAAVALAVQADDPAAVERLLRELGQACADLPSQAQAAPAGAEPGRLSAERLLQDQALLLGGDRLADGALAFTTELAARLGAERVSLGLQRREGMAVLAVSHSAELRLEQALLHQLAEVMQEAADQAERVAYPAPAGELPRLSLLHARLHQQTGHHLVSLPLAHHDRVVGALLFEWLPTRAPDAARITQCEQLALAVAPLLPLRRRAERPWRDRLLLALGRLPERLRQPDDPRPRLLAGALAVALAGALSVPLPQHVSAPARLEGAVQRVVAAPFDGFLQRSSVRPGDVVKAGALLAELADQDLQLEARKWESALAQHENGVAAALARDDRSQFVVSRGKADEARAQLELVRQQLGRARLVAPIDGVVIQGDLSRSLGAPVQRGDVLLTLAPAGQYRLIVEVDERDIAALRPGQTGQLALASMPTERLPLVVQRITPVATLVEGRNRFAVEARLEGVDPAALRPGLQGVARIEAGTAPLAWIASHRLVDWARLAGWAWLP